jgi:YVTN family beta-propeller protein
VTRSDSDLEARLRAALGGDHGLVAAPDDLAEIVRSRHRRQRRSQLTIAAAGVAVALLLLGVQLISSGVLSSGQRADPATSPPVVTPSASTPPSRAAAPADVVTVDVLASVPVGEDPVEVAVDPAGEAVYVANSRDGTVSVIDTATREVVETITVGRQPRGLAVDPAAGLVYVASVIEGEGSVSVIDSGTRQVIDTISLGAGTGSGELGIDPRTNSLFVVNGDGTLSVVDTQSRQVVETLAVGRTVLGMAVDPEEGAAFVSSGGTVTVIDTRTRRIVKIVEWGGAAQLAVDSTAGLLLVANEADGTVSVFDTATHELIATVVAGGPYGPFGVATDPTAGLAYVTGGSVLDADGDGATWLVAVMDTDTLEVVETITWDDARPRVGGLPLAVADPATDSLYVLDAGFVTVIARR